MSKYIRASCCCCAVVFVYMRAHGFRIVHVVCTRDVHELSADISAVVQFKIATNQLAVSEEKLQISVR